MSVAAPSISPTQNPILTSLPPPSIIDNHTTDSLSFEPSNDQGSVFCTGVPPHLNNCPFPLANPKPLCERKRNPPNPIFVACSQMDLCPDFAGRDLHVAAQAQIFSIKPETPFFPFIDFSHISKQWVRIRPPSVNPLHYKWPVGFRAIVLSNRFHVPEILEKAILERTKLILLVTDPNIDTLKIISVFSEVNLRFIRDSPIFTPTENQIKQPKTFLACFLNMGLTVSPLGRPIRRIAHIHKDWDTLVPVPTCSWNIEAFKNMLVFHPDDDFVFRVLDFAQFGVSYLSSIFPLKPVIQNPSTLFDWKTMGPLMDAEREKNFCSSPFKISTKDPTSYPLFNICSYQTFSVTKNFSDKVRKVNNLSKGPSAGNDFMAILDKQEWFPFHKAREIVTFFGRNTLIHVRDVSKAYKTPFLKPQDWNKAGESLPSMTPSTDRGTKAVVLNLKVVFGAKTSFQLWDQSGGSFIEFAYNTTVRNILLSANLSPSKRFAISKWVDDYHMYIAPNIENSIFTKRTRLCEQIESILNDLDVELGLDMTSKTFATRMKILGHIIDSSAMTVSITPERKVFLIQLVNSLLGKSQVTLKEMESIHGHLRFAAQVVEAGSIHCNPLSAVVGVMKRKKIFTYTSTPWLRLALSRWLAILTHKEFLGLSLLLQHDWERAEELDLICTGGKSDAAFIGEGFFFGNLFLSRPWPPIVLKWAQRAKSTSQKFLEAFTTVDMLATFGPLLRHKFVIINCDNQAWVDVWKSKKAHCPFFATLLICLSGICSIYDIKLRIEHIAGIDNVLADHLSRLRVEVTKIFCSFFYSFYFFLFRMF